MHFRPEECDAFREIFDSSKDQIRHFPGCHALSLHNEAGMPEVFFTYSLWQSEAHLDAYRHSELFQGTWKKTKALFADRPLAWSMEELEAVGAPPTGGD